MKIDILTIFPQLVVHIYFLVGQAGIGWFNLPIETAMSQGFRFSGLPHRKTLPSAGGCSGHPLHCYTHRRCWQRFVAAPVRTSAVWSSPFPGV